MCMFILTGCKSEEKDMKEDSITYKEITQEAAYQMMDDNVIIIDVRESDEYNTGHINNAINISVNHIVNKIKDEVSSKDQVILLYCRSGARATSAAKLLVSLGYSNVYTFGGIETWPYEIVN